MPAAAPSSLRHPIAEGPPDAAGALGIFGLKRYWARALATRSGRPPPPLDAQGLRADRVLLAGLRLGLRETLACLMGQAPSFPDFEAWVLARNGGTLAPERIQRLNATLSGQGGGFALETIATEAVLSAAELAFWDSEGYVVLRQAVTPEACQAAIAAIADHAGLSMQQPASWQVPDLWVPLAHHPALWANRLAPRVHTAFAQLWGRSDLWVDVDVCGVNPPWQPGTAFKGTPLHWDMSLAAPLGFGTQGILYLNDTPAHQGAFSCVPGFHRRLQGWLDGLPPGADPRALAPAGLPATPIAGQAGDLVIWHQALPHAAMPNRGRLPRVVQYLNMFPADYPVNADWR